MNLSFHLTDEFIEQYKKREVPWGYKDAAGNAFSEIVFLRTYSRLKEDGTKERWWEVCRRVIEGMFSIQKDHCRANRIPWNARKAHAAAEDAFERLFMFKWTPPGRGLWMMGTPLVNERKNSAALQNCFSADTQIVTKDGSRALGELVGQTTTISDTQGWQEATVSSFGVQPVQRVTFAPAMKNSRGLGFRGNRSNLRHTITVTPNHRWILADGSETTSLSVNDFVPGVAAFGTWPTWNKANELATKDGPVDPNDYGEDWVGGFQHGYIFGDGNVSSGSKRRFEAPLCGPNEELFAPFFGGARYTSSAGYPVCVVHSDENLKDFPSEDKNAEYLRGFLHGWIAADGSRTNAGNLVLATTNLKAKAWLSDHASTAGMVYTGYNVSSNTETNYGPRNYPLQIHTLTLSQDRYWKVVAIEPLEEPEEVYCATVPNTGKFALANGILTGNCSFVSTADMTKYDPTSPFTFLMEASMLGIGVGFDTKGAEKNFEIYNPRDYDDEPWIIPDTREGWVDSTRMVLEAYLLPNHSVPIFDYSQIRPAGTLIKTFGGTAAGPDPLIRLHETLVEILDKQIGNTLNSRTIADIGNLIGVCVVSGNVRRSAELLLGDINDNEFLTLKDYNGKGKDRAAWSWMSNNSVAVNVGDDLSKIINGIAQNGEPGVVWMDVSRKFGRLNDPANNKDWRAAGYNPCAEQTLESFECCTLVETYLNRHTDVDDYIKTLKVAYLYAKTVTLMATHWERTNAIMLRNRRIGTSMSGIANFADNNGIPVLRDWMDKGYSAIQKLDEKYSEWLCVRQSIKTTTVKPSGTVSILAGESPGVHWSPGGKYFRRAVRFAKDEPLVAKFRAAGYTVEAAESDPTTTVVVYFPIQSSAKRSEHDVTLYEKAALAATAQRWWSDNSVSVTLSFDPQKESDHVGSVLGVYEGQLKTVSFLPMINEGAYPQMPYSGITESEYEDSQYHLWPVDLESIYNGDATDAEGEIFCETDVCVMKEEIASVQ